jgi:hypothetical protein
VISVLGGLALNVCHNITEEANTVRVAELLDPCDWFGGYGHTQVLEQCERWFSLKTCAEILSSFLHIALALLNMSVVIQGSLRKV